MLNNVTVQGRLCAAPELKTTPNGTAVVRFRIGCTRNYKNANGEYDSDFLNVIAWRGTAELVSKRFGKGDMIIVSGSLKTGSYSDKDGKKVYTTDIEADSVYFVGSKPKPDDSGYFPDEPPAPDSRVAAPKMDTAADERAAFANAPSDDYPF